MNTNIISLAAAITHRESPEIGWSQLFNRNPYLGATLTDDAERDDIAALPIADATRLAQACGALADEVNSRYWATAFEMRDESDRLLVEVMTQAQGAFEEISGNVDILPATMTISEYLRRFRNMDWRQREQSPSSEVAS